MSDNDNDETGGPVPSFPAFGVSRAGEALSADMRPPPPETKAPDPDKVAAMLNPSAALGSAAEEVAPPAMILVLDDDFFGAMDLADAVADALQGEVRTALSDQKAAMIIAEERLSLAVLSISTPGASTVAAQLTKLSVPFALLSEDGQGGMAAEAYPDAPILRRGTAGAAMQALIGDLLQP